MKLDPSPTDYIFFSNSTGPECKRHWRGHSLQPRIGPEKSRGSADWYARCTFTFIQFIYLIISLLLYIFACLIHIISEFGFWNGYKRDSFIKIKSIG